SSDLRELDQRRQLLDVRIGEERRLRGDAGALYGVLVRRVVDELRPAAQRRGCARAVRDHELAAGELRRQLERGGLCRDLLEQRPGGRERRLGIIRRQLERDLRDQPGGTDVG